jgi:hypothetical protein
LRNKATVAETGNHNHTLREDGDHPSSMSIFRMKSMRSGDEGARLQSKTQRHHPTKRHSSIAHKIDSAVKSSAKNSVRNEPLSGAEEFADEDSQTKTNREDTAKYKTKSLTNACSSNKCPESTTDQRRQERRYLMENLGCDHRFPYPNVRISDKYHLVTTKKRNKFQSQHVNDESEY